jgi:hypothetical protein
MKRSAVLIGTLATALFAGLALGGRGWQAHSAAIERETVTASSDERADDHTYRKCQARHWRDYTLSP